MIVWGYGSEAKDLGKIGRESCSHCANTSDFHAVLRYSYFGLYWVFNMVVKKQFFLLCGTCQRGWELSKEEATQLDRISNIPKHHRYGLACLVAIPVSLFFFTVVLGVGR